MSPLLCPYNLPAIMPQDEWTQRDVVLLHGEDAPATLAQAVADSEYDLQYVIYTLALHRWLRFRLGAAYDPATHLGGVRYLFCRGLDAFDPASPGIHAVSLPVSLIESLDRLFALPAGATA